MRQYLIGLVTSLLLIIAPLAVQANQPPQLTEASVRSYLQTVNQAARKGEVEPYVVCREGGKGDPAAMAEIERGWEIALEEWARPGPEIDATSCRIPTTGPFAHLYATVHCLEVEETRSRTVSLTVGREWERAGGKTRYGRLFVTAVYVGEMTEGVAFRPQQSLPDDRQLVWRQGGFASGERVALSPEGIRPWVTSSTDQPFVDALNRLNDGIDRHEESWHPGAGIFLKRLEECHRQARMGTPKSTYFTPEFLRMRDGEETGPQILTRDQFAELKGFAHYHCLYDGGRWARLIILQGSASSVSLWRLAVFHREQPGKPWQLAYWEAVHSAPQGNGPRLSLAESLPSGLFRPPGREQLMECYDRVIEHNAQMDQRSPKLLGPSYKPIMIAADASLRELVLLMENPSKQDWQVNDHGSGMIRVPRYYLIRIFMTAGGGIDEYEVRNVGAQGDELSYLESRFAYYLFPYSLAEVPNTGIGGAGSTFTLTELARSDLGKPLLRLLRMIQLNNQAEARRYLGGELATPAGWQRLGALRLADPCEIAVSEDVAGTVTFSYKALRLVGKRESSGTIRLTSAR